MARSTRTRGRNLFAIDLSAIESTLREANKSLLLRRDELLVAFEGLPSALETSEQIDRAIAFAREVDDVLKEARAARLADGRPFSDASKTIKDFFVRIEGPMKASMDELQRRVTSAVRRQREEAERAATQAEALDRSAEPPVAIASTLTGEAVVVAADKRASEVPLEWVIADVDREKIDLEQLRPFFTDAQLLAACRKHLGVNGPHKLTGVSYEQVAAAL